MSFSWSRHLCPFTVSVLPKPSSLAIYTPHIETCIGLGELLSHVPGLTSLHRTDLSSEANVLFTSDSLVDILGYQPHEVQGTSGFDYFHPDEVLVARLVHRRSVLLDKAAALHYARLLCKDGRWVSCECYFTIVHDVMVACTRVYRRGKKSESASQDDFYIDRPLRTLLIRC